MDWLPPKIGKFVLVGVAVGVDKSEIIHKLCLESNFTEFHFNFGLRQQKSG